MIALPGKDENVVGLFKLLCDRLNCCVHRFGELRELLISEVALLARDTFDKR
jgi:hypothetical protein